MEMVGLFHIPKFFRCHLLSNTESSKTSMIPLRFVLTLSGVLFITALGLWLMGGYHSSFLVLNSLGSVIPDNIWSSITLLGDTQVAIALLLFVIYIHPKLLSATIIAIIPTTLITHGMKAFFSMERPGSVLPEGSFHLVGKLLHTNSFPSGHSATAGVIATFFLVIAKNTQQRIAIVCVLLLIMFSRVMVGAHWPIDVLVGGAIGLLCGLACYKVAKHYHFCKSALSQWIAMVIPLYCVVTLPFHNGGYPQGHFEVTLIIAIAFLFYLNQLRNQWLISKKH